MLLLLLLLLELLGNRIDSVGRLLVLAEMLLDDLTKVLLADHRPGAVALGLLLQIGAEGIQVEFGVPRLGALGQPVPGSGLERLL